MFCIFPCWRDGIKIPCIQINLPAHKVHFCSKCRWLGFHAKPFEEKKGINVVLGSTAIFVGLLSLSVTCMMQQIRKTANRLILLERYFNSILEKIAFYAKWPRSLLCCLKLISGRNHTSFMGFYCKSISPKTKQVHSATNENPNQFVD